MNMEIRPAAADDVVPIADLTEQLGYVADGVAERLPAMLSREGASVMVAVVDGAIAGWIHVHDAALVQVAPFGEVGGLVVGEEHRGTGVGEHLLAAAEAWAIGRGHSEMRVRSNAIRARAHGFYLRHGYAIEKTSLTFHKSF